MLGPKIIRDESAEPPRSVKHAAPQTGIRRTNTGGWAAIRDDRLVGTYEGAGAKRLAIANAGTNEVIS